MNKYLVLTLLVIPSITSAAFNRDLYYGLQDNPQVTELQEFLTAQGVYSGPITGNFFSLTLQGVKNFQTKELISPVSGYFGPLSRAKANSLLAAVTDESGTPISPAITPPKTMDDVVANLIQQINLLQQQLDELKTQQVKLDTQQQTLGFIQQEQASTTVQVAQQTEILQQIQQQTVPLPPPPPPVPIQTPAPTPPLIVKELRGFGNWPCSPIGCSGIEIRYFENGEQKHVSFTVSSDSGSFWANCGQGQAEGNPITVQTCLSGRDGKPTGFFAYIPDTTATSTLTAPGVTVPHQARQITITANSITSTGYAWWQTSQ